MTEGKGKDLQGSNSFKNLVNQYMICCFKKEWYKIQIIMDCSPLLKRHNQNKKLN